MDQHGRLNWHTPLNCCPDVILSYLNDAIHTAGMVLPHTRRCVCEHPLIISSKNQSLHNRMAVEARALPAANVDGDAVGSSNAFNFYPPPSHPPSKKFVVYDGGGSRLEGSQAGPKLAAFICRAKVMVWD